MQRDKHMGMKAGEIMKDTKLMGHRKKMESWNGKIRTVKCFRGLQSQGRCNIGIEIMTGKERK